MDSFLSQSPEDTFKFASQFAKKIKKLPALVLLNGPLGAGKTHFAQGFIRSFVKTKSPVLSPSYSIVNAYEGGGKTLYHVDLYRVRSVDDLESLGFWDFFDKKSLVLVEWGNKLPVEWPKSIFCSQIDFEIKSESERVLKISWLSERELPS